MLSPRPQLGGRARARLWLKPTATRRVPSVCRTCESGWPANSRHDRVIGRRLAFLAGHLLALVRIEVALAQADALRCHFDQLVVLNIGDRLLERHPPRRGQTDAFVLAA